MSSILDHLFGGPTPGPQPGAEPEAKPLDLLRQALGLLHQYVQVEPDEQDKAQATKFLAGIQQLLAKDEADRQKVLGDSSIQRVLRKQ